jgi:hypothetical protein
MNFCNKCGLAFAADMEGMRHQPCGGIIEKTGGKVMSDEAKKGELWVVIERLDARISSLVDSFDAVVKRLGALEAAQKPKPMPPEGHGDHKEFCAICFGAGQDEERRRARRECADEYEKWLMDADDRRSWEEFIAEWRG